MANQRKSMNKIREILRLSEDCGLTQRTIEKALGVSRPVVSQYISYFKATGLSYEATTAMGDDELLEALGKRRKEESEQYRILADKFEYYATEIKRVGAEFFSEFDLKRVRQLLFWRQEELSDAQLSMHYSV